MLRCPPACLAAALAVALACASTLTWAADKPHHHGTAALAVAVEGAGFSVVMQVPLYDLLGFERAPRNDTERKAAKDLLARLQDQGKSSALFVADAAAQCRLHQASVHAPVLGQGQPSRAAGEHADLETRQEYICAQPGALRSLDAGLFDAFPRIQRIDVQLVSAQGQSKATLTRKARILQLGR